MKFITKGILTTIFLLSNGVVMALENNIYLNASDKSFAIQVKAIPTTGFVWSVKSYDKESFKFEGSEYLKTKVVLELGHPIVGAPIQEVFKFKLLKPLKVKKTIQLFLARSWESKEFKTSTYIIQLKSDKKNVR